MSKLSRNLSSLQPTAILPSARAGAVQAWLNNPAFSGGLLSASANPSKDPATDFLKQLATGSTESPAKKLAATIGMS